MPCFLDVIAPQLLNLCPDFLTGGPHLENNSFPSPTFGGLKTVARQCATLIEPGVKEWFGLRQNARHW
jgi:hypothetical protein